MSTDPSSLTERVKNHTREFVEQQWASLSQFQKAKSIFKQFATKANPYNELLKDQPSLILKTRRVEYVFEKIRSLNLQGPPSTLSDFAENQLVGEVRFWTTKYYLLSWVGGANIAFFGYHLAFKHLKRYIGLPLTIATFFLSRNIIMKRCMDKVYYPLQPLYEKMRAEEKKKVQMMKDTKDLHRNETKIQEEDLRKQQRLSADIQAMTEEEIAEQEMKAQKEIANKQLDEYMYKIHG